MKNCKTCGNAIFDEVFGDYKCSISKTTIRLPLSTKCKDYKEGKPVDSKKERDS